MLKEGPMEHLALLLQYGKVVTIFQDENGGFMISFSEIEAEDDELFFVPEQILMSKSSLDDALQAFMEHQQMLHVQGYHA